MFEQLEVFIKDNRNDIIVTGGITEEKIHILENNLDLKFNKDIKTFLSRYGVIVGYGIEILGCGKNGESSLVRETQRFRKYGLEREYIVIRNVDEWIYCLNNNDGKVSSWDRTDKKHLLKEDSFERYVLNELVNAKEEWD